MQTPAGSAYLNNHVTLNIDLLTSGSKHAERLPCLVLIAQAAFLLDRGHRDSQSQMPPIMHPVPRIYYAGVGQ